MTISRWWMQHGSHLKEALKELCLESSFRIQRSQLFMSIYHNITASSWQFCRGWPESLQSFNACQMRRSIFRTLCALRTSGATWPCHFHIQSSSFNFLHASYIRWPPVFAWTFWEKNLEISNVFDSFDYPCLELSRIRDIPKGSKRHLGTRRPGTWDNSGRFCWCKAPISRFTRKYELRTCSMTLGDIEEIVLHLKNVWT